VAIANDDSSIISKGNFKLSDDPRVIIYNYHRFIIQATDLCVMAHLQEYNFALACAFLALACAFL